jgi:hypothetical protein
LTSLLGCLLLKGVPARSHGFTWLLLHDLIAGLLLRLLQ